MANLENFVASVEVPSGLKPMGNNTFPIAQAHDILAGYDEDGNEIRLDDKLDGIQSTHWYSGKSTLSNGQLIGVILTAKIGDMYLNTDTGDVYRCTKGGSWVDARWETICNIKGTNGKSAYEYAKANGYTGTEAQFSAMLANSVDKTKITLGLHKDGLLYVFIDGLPVGSGVSLSSGGSSIPRYYYTETSRVIGLIEAFKAAHPNHLVFGVVSDIHTSNSDEIISEWNITKEEASKKSIQHAAYALEVVGSAIGCDFIANLGDNCEEVHIDPSMTTASKPCGLENAQYAINTLTPAFDKLVSFNLVGNHDKSDHTSDQYNLIGVHNDFDVASDTIIRGFGYKDYTDKKVRVIVLNTCDYLNASGGCALSYEQKDFLMRALDLSEKSNTSEWQILLLSHIPLDWYPKGDDANGTYDFYPDLQAILNAYEDGDTASIIINPSYALNETPSSYATYSNGKLVYNYSGKNDAKIIANIHGHLHNNKVGKIENTNIARVATGSVNPYGTRTAENYLSYGDYAITQDDLNAIKKQPGTARDTSATFYCIDLDNEMIYAYGYGADANRTISFADAPVYTVTRNISDNITSSNKVDFVTENSAYSTTLTVASGYVLVPSSLSVKMGDNDVPAESIQVNGNTITITIGAVNGNIVITATAKVATSYTNIIDSVGTVDDVRLRSGGATGSAAGFASNYFPVNANVNGDRIIRVYFPNGNRASIPSNGVYCCTYSDNSGTLVAAYDGSTGSSVLQNVTDKGYEIHIPKDQICSYARVAGGPNGAYTGWVVTVNEEIK